MNRITGSVRAFAYPLVGLVVISSLWVLAAEKAKTDKFDSEYVEPLQRDQQSQTLQTSQAAPAEVATAR